MRIISGFLKSRRITAPKNLPVRPTTDMAKEAVFNIINNWYHFSELEVLDLFTGTGNISYEFASRGTQHITAVDQHFGCIQFVNKTSQEFKLPILTIKSDVFKFLNNHQGNYDVIFADPPYEFSDEQFLSIVNGVFKQELLNDEGILIIEHSDNTNLAKFPNFREAKKYGGCVFSFFELANN